MDGRSPITPSPLSPVKLSASVSPSTPRKAVAGATTNGASAGGAGLGETDLWGSILSSTSGSKSIVSKNAIVLGSHKSGKSTLISRLASPSGAAAVEVEDANGSGSIAKAIGGAAGLDLGLSFTYIDIGDEADEAETVARLGVYQLPSPEPPYPSLLPLALSKSTLLDSIAVIVLDWERPWKFLKELRGWIGVLEGVLKGKGVSEGWEGAEGKERLESHLRHYAEPSTAGASSQLADLDAPLPPGVLTDNLGIGLVIVCTKADQINFLEREKDFKEEQFDYIQQTLRAVALKYGAAIFYTSHSRPESFSKLRSYILHRLFVQPPIQPASSLTASALGTLAPQSSPTASRTFPFNVRANVVDRDQVLVPTGWDSWGKIRILRDRFDADAAGKGWDLDMDRLRAGPGTVDEEFFDEEGKRVTSSMRQYENVVVDLDADDKPINMSNSRVEAQDEQEFFKAYYEVLQEEREKDPRSAFARPADGSNGGDMPFGASVVGPIGSGGLNLPNVERALEQNPDDGIARSVKATRRESTQGVRSPTLGSNYPSPSLGASTTSPTLNGSISPNLGSTHLSPSNSSTGTPGGTNSSNEVLQNFFQSLLAQRGAPGAVRPGLSPPLTSSAPGSRQPGSSAMNSRTPSAQNEQ
ncbi:hypothetical protein T439DRAFT_320094 [Meredithblackwellia eburnea MCA 4105]